MVNWKKSDSGNTEWYSHGFERWGIFIYEDSLDLEGGKGGGGLPNCDVILQGGSSLLWQSMTEWGRVLKKCSNLRDVIYECSIIHHSSTNDLFPPIYYLILFAWSGGCCGPQSWHLSISYQRLTFGNSARANLAEVPMLLKTVSSIPVVYFDQLSGAARTLKLVEKLFSAISNLFLEKDLKWT